MARRGERPPIGLTWVVTWPLSAAFAALVFLAAEELRHPSPNDPPYADHVVARPPEKIGGPDWRAHFPERIDAVDAALRKSSLQLPKPLEDERGSGPLRWRHRSYEIVLPRADQAQAEAVIAALQGVDPGLAATTENVADGAAVRVGLDGLLVSTLRFRWAEAVTAKPVKPRVAVVIGPLGDDLRTARQAVAVEGPVALGVRPARPFSRQVAELARMFNREVVVLMRCGERSSDEDGGIPACGNLRNGLEDMLSSVPQAVGVVWQGGECKSLDPGLVREVERRGLVFIGKCKVGEGGAAIPALAVIADGEPDAVTAQLTALLEQARSGGAGIVIGAPTEATLATLTQALLEWQTAEVDVVPVSALPPAVALSAR